MASQDFLFDKRVLQRNVEKGLVDQKTVQKTISSLPDRADNAAVTSVDALDGEDDVADAAADGSDEE
jgi:hypothetical protein